MTLTCRSPSPSVEQHLRCKKIGGDDKKYRSSPIHEDHSEPGPSTSKCNYSEHSQRCSEQESIYAESLQVNTRPPIGRRKQDILVKTRAGPCPVSKTPKRKVDQLSPTMKYTYDFPSTIESNSHKSETDCVLSNRNSISKCDKQSNKDSIDEANVYSFTMSNEQKPVKESVLFKTPEKCAPVKVHPYRKPVTLSVSTNQSFVGSKRLPSPKVLVTGSKKPDPTDFKKRCLDLNSSDASQEPNDEFSSIKPLDEMVSSDLHDLIKPLSPSELEAYLSSLSNKAPRKHGVSTLDDIPTTNCSFFLGDEGESMLNGSQIGKTKPKNKNISPKEDSKKSCLSTNEEPALPNSSILTKDGESVVRNLFNRSNSSPEMETNFVLFESKQTSNAETSRVVENQCKKEIVDCDHLKHMIERCDSDLSSNIRGDNHDNLSSSSLSREVTLESQSGDSRKTQSFSCRNSKLFNLSIPCSIGGVNSAINSLAQNLETMDIEADVSCNNLSSSVDSEVENHFKDEVLESNVGTLDKECSTDTCDKSPTRDLSLCKQLLKRDFHQNVQNVSLL